MRKALIITYYWPPSGGSGVQRWLKLSKYLSQFGYKPIVYTPLNPDVNATDKSLEGEIASGVEVLKYPIREPYMVYKWFKGMKRKEHIKANVIEGEQNRGFANYVRSNFFIPDPRKWWIKPSINFLTKYLEQNRVDVIITTGPPHSMHLIGKELYRRFSIPWVSDFRDLWTDIFYFKHLQLTRRSLKKHIQLEESVLAQSGGIVVVSNNMRERIISKLVKHYNDDIILREEGGEEFILKMAQEKVCVIENGFDPHDFDEDKNSALRSKLAEIEKITRDKFIIGHTGLLTDSANPSQMWEALGMLIKANETFAKDLLIVTSGETGLQTRDDIEKNGLTDKFLDLGYSPHLKAVALQKKSHILLLPLRKEPEAKGILTGKFFEYLSSGSPIIAFGVENSDIENILAKTQSGTFFQYSDSPEVIEEIKNKILQIWNSFSMERPMKNDPKRVEQFSRIAQAERYAKFLDTIIEEYQSIGIAENKK